MNNQQPYEPGPNSEETPAGPQQPPINDWRDERAQRRAMRREARQQRYAGGYAGSGTWIGGAVLILIGVAFLLRNTGVYDLRNWWALFILIPAVSAFSAAWAAYRASGGHLTAAARGSLVAGLLFTFVTFIFLFNVNFGLFWPVLLIFGGLAILVSAILPG